MAFSTSSRSSFGLVEMEVISDSFDGMVCTSVFFGERFYGRRPGTHRARARTHNRIPKSPYIIKITKRRHAGVRVGVA